MPSSQVLRNGEASFSNPEVYALIRSKHRGPRLDLDTCRRGNCLAVHVGVACGEAVQPTSRLRVLQPNTAVTTMGRLPVTGDFPANVSLVIVPRK